MTKNRTFHPLDPLPADWADSLSEFISTLEANFAITIGTDTTTLQVIAGSDNAQACIGINGRWRYNIATVTASSPGGGSARWLDVWVTATDNSFASSSSGEVDNTTYSFALAITESGASPAGAVLSRKVGSGWWDGTRFTTVKRMHPNVPDDGSVTGGPAGAGVKLAALTVTAENIANGTITDQKIAAGAAIARSKLGVDVDGVASDPSLRTLGTGAQQAAAGNDSRLSDARTPTAHAASHAPGGSDHVPGLAPIGAIIAYAGSGDPSGLAGEWVIADGRLIDRTTFAGFFAAAGHVYNAGVDPGSNKVKIPDKRGRKSVGALNMGTGAATLDNSRVNAARGASGGESAHTVLSSEMPGHTHALSDPTHNHGLNDPGHAHGGTFLQGGSFHTQGYPQTVVGGHTDVVFSNDEFSAGMAGAVTNIGVFSSGTFISIGSVGGSGAHNNLDPFESDAYLVRIA